MEGKISELLKEQIEKSEYPVVGAKVNNEYKQINGNLIGALFANYILENKNINID